MADYKQRSQEYAQKLKDPRWQKKRLKILERDEWTCQNCWSTTSSLAVHHKYYLNKTEPWDYLDDAFITLCEDCHDMEFIQKDNDMDLMASIRLNFLSNEIFVLADGFYQAYIPRKDALWTTELIRWILTNSTLRSELIQRLWIDIHKDEQKVG